MQWNSRAQSFTLWAPDDEETERIKKATRSNTKALENTQMKFIKTDFYCDENICLVKAILIVLTGGVWLACDVFYSFHFVIIHTTKYYTR